VSASPRHAVLFVHIQKTAGMSLYNALARAFAPGESMRFERSQEAFKQQFLAMPEAELKRYRLLSGHFNLPLWLSRDLGPRLVLSAVREPVDRVLSTYRYMRSWKGHRRHASAGQLDIAGFVDDYANDPSRHNVQCMRLCGAPEFARAKAMAARAIDILGAVEAMPQLVAAIDAALGVAIDVGVDNRSAIQEPRREAIDPALIARLRDCNAEDAKLFDYVMAEGVVRGGTQA
jgi:hypothetical protein